MFFLFLLSSELRLDEEVIKEGKTLVSLEGDVAAVAAVAAAAAVAADVSVDAPAVLVLE